MTEIYPMTRCILELSPFHSPCGFEGALARQVKVTWRPASRDGSGISGLYLKSGLEGAQAEIAGGCWEHTDEEMES